MGDTDEIIKALREKALLEDELRALKAPLPLPEDLTEPLYLPTRGGWFADALVEDEVARRKELQDRWTAEKNARKQRSLQVGEMIRVLNKQLKKLLSSSTARSVRSAESKAVPKQSACHGKKRQISPSEKRAQTVATLINELNRLKPDMYGRPDYERLERENSKFLSFREAAKRPELKEKLLNLQAHRRHYRLAQELAAAYHGRQLSTLQTDWKKHKPKSFRRTQS